MTKFIGRNKGFTLLEVSIVILITGIILSAIITGKSILDAYRLRSIITDITNFVTATNTFKVKYHALPGDLTKASSYWANCTAGGANCDGDGDGLIDSASGSSNPTEDLGYWQHLSLAKLVGGTYNGLAYSGGVRYSAGNNAPASKIKKGGYLAKYTTDVYGTSGNVLQMGKEAGGSFGGALISPIEAAYIDRKMDDDLANNGKMRAANGTDAIGNCVSGGVYQLSNDATSCYTWFFIDKF